MVHISGSTYQQRLWGWTDCSRTAGKCPGKVFLSSQNISSASYWVWGSILPPRWKPSLSSFRHLLQLPNDENTPPAVTAFWCPRRDWLMVELCFCVAYRQCERAVNTQRGFVVYGAVVWFAHELLEFRSGGGNIHYKFLVSLGLIRKSLVSK